MFRKIAVAMPVVAVLLVSGCASVPMAPADQDAALKTFAPPPPDKSGLYIYRDSFAGQALKKNVYVDGELLGETANKVYFYKQVAPGQHKIATESEFSENELDVKTEGGLNYFIRQYIKVGVFVGGANVELVSEEEGRRGVLNSNLAK